MGPDAPTRTPGHPWTTALCGPPLHLVGHESYIPACYGAMHWPEPAIWIPRAWDCIVSRRHYGSATSIQSRSNPCWLLRCSIHQFIFSVFVEPPCRLNRTMDPTDQRILNEPGCSEEPEMKKQQTCEGTEPCTEIFTDSAAVVALTTPEVKTCGTCHKSTTDWTPNNSSGVRCKLCNAFKSRMQRVFHKNEDVRTSWNELSQSARDEWLKAAEQHMGVKDLGKALMLTWKSQKRLRMK